MKHNPKLLRSCHHCNIAPFGNLHLAVHMHGIAMAWSKTKSSGVRFSCSMPSFERMRSALTSFRKVGKGQLEIVEDLE